MTPLPQSAVDAESPMKPTEKEMEEARKIVRAWDSEDASEETLLEDIATALAEARGAAIEEERDRFSYAQDLVMEERDRQEAKWGQQEHDPAHYLAILGEEYGEAAKEVVEYLAAKTEAERHKRLIMLRTELVQTAAVAVAMTERVDRIIASSIRSLLSPQGGKETA